MELFGTAGIRGPVGEAVDPGLALRVGQAVGRAAVTGDRGARVAVGRDGRLTGAGLADAVAAGVQAAGATAVVLGQVPTPTVGWASRGGHGVAVTASHNPPADNGLKLFVDGVEYDAAAERRVEERVGDGAALADWADWGRRRDRTAVLERYREAVETHARRHGAALDGLRVVVDTGTGVGGLATPAVLRALGADVVTLHGEVDGRFGGRSSKPTADALGDLSGVLETDPDAALGLAHDGDADRLVVLDGDGTVVHEDTILAVLAEHHVRTRTVPDPVVVTTPNASDRVDERVRAAGGRVERVALGAVHEGVATVEREGGTVVFAGEPWKHIHPRLGGWIDGVAGAAVLARLVAPEGLAALVEPVTERPYRKVSLDCPEAAKEPVMEVLADRLPAAFPAAAVSTDHGLRLSLPDGAWTLVRPSGTEPKVRVYAESDTVDDLLEEVLAVVREGVETVVDGTADG